MRGTSEWREGESRSRVTNKMRRESWRVTQTDGSGEKPPSHTHGWPRGCRRTGRKHALSWEYWKWPEKPTSVEDWTSLVLWHILMPSHSFRAAAFLALMRTFGFCFHSNYIKDCKYLISIIVTLNLIVFFCFFFLNYTSILSVFHDRELFQMFNALV